METEADNFKENLKNMLNNAKLILEDKELNDDLL